MQKLQSVYFVGSHTINKEQSTSFDSARADVMGGKADVGGGEFLRKARRIFTRAELEFWEVRRGKFDN